jgi:RNA polymerase sigma-70 factor (ECF subfamily)
MITATPARAFPMSRPHEEAFIAAFDEFADALFRHAAYRVSSREKAADITQDAFVKAWDYVRDGGDVHHWKSFLFRVLNNLIIDEYRRAKEVSLDAMHEDDPAHASALTSFDGRAETEARLDDEMLIARIRSFIPELPETLRVAVALRYIDGFSPKEIAALLETSENVVSVRIHRGVARLKELCNAPE